MRDLAKKIGGVTEAAVRKWLAHAEWKFPRTPPFDVAAIRAWRRATLSENPAEKPGSDPPPQEEKLTANSVAGSRVALNIQRAAKIKLEREILARKYTLNEDVDRQNIERITAIKSALFALARTASHELAGQSAAAIEQILNDRFTALCNDFADEIPSEENRSPTDSHQDEASAA